MEKYITINEALVSNLIDNQNEILNLLQQQKTTKITNSSLFTVSEAASYLNISEVFVRKLIDQNKLIVKRIGDKAIRIEKNELDRLAN